MHQITKDICSNYNPYSTQGSRIIIAEDKYIKSRERQQAS